MFADDIVLIADSAQSLQAMLDVCILVFSRWQFTVSADKTRVVSLGHCETLESKDRSWQIGDTCIKDVSSYTYLGIEFDRSANWLFALRNNVEKCRQSMRHLYSLMDDPDQGLDVGHLAEIWGLFAHPRLLYGSEIWSAPSASALESLEVAKTMAGRQILGKPGFRTLSKKQCTGIWVGCQSNLI
jgi:hypothetical protein